MLKLRISPKGYYWEMRWMQKYTSSYGWAKMWIGPYPSFEAMKAAVARVPA